MDDITTQPKQKSNKGKIWISILIAFLTFSVIIYLIPNFLHKAESSVNIESRSLDKKSNDKSDTNKKLSADYIKAVTPESDSTTKIVNISNPDSANVPEPYFDEAAGKYIKKVYKGRRINISVTGVDARIGTNSKHADANHIISILLDSGKIEIISVPRDTPADAGFEDSTGQNKLTIVRANRGREAYLKELANIAGLDKIHYYIEFGFSQAMGIIDWLGYKDAASTLQILRSRQGLGGDDYQRQYNQGNFIKTALKKHFSKFSGFMGDVMIYGSLSMVETNLTHSTMKEIISELDKKGFATNADNITQKIRPSMPIKFKVYDFNNDQVMSELSNKIKNYNSYRDKHDTTFNYSKVRSVENILYNVIASAEVDTIKRPAQVISKLNIYFEQRAWLQVSDNSKRADIRNRISNMLITAYQKKNNNSKAQNIKSIVEAEKKLFEQK